MSPLLRWWRTAHRVSELLSYMAPTSALSWGDGLTRPWRSRPESRHGLKSTKLEHRTLPFWTDLHGIRVWETIGKMGQLWGNKGIHAYICMNKNIVIYIYMYSIQKYCKHLEVINRGTSTLRTFCVLLESPRRPKKCQSVGALGAKIYWSPPVFKYRGS